MEQEIKEAVKILNNGGIVIFPTDTAYGIGCRMDDKKAIARLFKIRKRPETKAMPVLVDSMNMAQEYLLPIPDDVKKKLINPFWPGPLTIILHCIKVVVPKFVRGGGDELGVRMPDNLTMLKIIKEVGVPILAPSANFSGEKTPYSLNEVNKDLINMVDFVICGECKTKKESTIIDCSQKPWKILRKGAVRVDF